MLRSELADGERPSTVEKSHKYIKYIDHDLMGRVYVYQHHASDQVLIMKEKVANNENHMRQEESNIEKRDLLRHPNLMVLKDWSCEKTSNFCATFYKMKTFYLFHFNNVEEMVKQKLKEGKNFEDFELMQLLYDGVDVLSYMQANGFSHGFIRPELVLKDEKGQYVLADRLLEGSSVDAQIYCRQSGFDMYCSPVIWNNLHTTKQEEHNPYKDDAFAFGLVLLKAANKQAPKSIYENNGVVNEAQLKRLIEQASANKYEHLPIFHQVLEKLLNVKEKERVDMITLKNTLPSREQIQQFFAEENGDLYFFDGPNSQKINEERNRTIQPLRNSTVNSFVRKTGGGFMDEPEEDYDYTVPRNNYSQAGQEILSPVRAIRNDLPATFVQSSAPLENPVSLRSFNAPPAQNGVSNPSNPAWANNVPSYSSFPNQQGTTTQIAPLRVSSQFSSPQQPSTLLNSRPLESNPNPTYAGVQRPLQTYQPVSNVQGVGQVLGSTYSAFSNYNPNSQPVPSSNLSNYGSNQPVTYDTPLTANQTSLVREKQPVLQSNPAGGYGQGQFGNQIQPNSQYQSSNDNQRQYFTNNAPNNLPAANKFAPLNAPTPLYNRL
jgi:hypothetical protein